MAALRGSAPLQPPAPWGPRGRLAGLGSMPQRGCPLRGLGVRLEVSEEQTAATFIPFMSYMQFAFMAAATLTIAPVLPVVFRLGSGAAGAPIHGTSVSAASLDFAAAGLARQALPSIQSSTASSTLSACLLYTSPSPRD